MLHPADIMFDRQPLRDFRRVERPVRRLRGEAQEIPRGIDEGVERIGLAPGGAAALRAIDKPPGRVAFERIARGRKIDILGQDHGQLVLGDGHDAACIAVDERDRRPPIALARNAPITQPPHGRAPAPAFPLGARDDLRLRVGHAHAIKEIAVDDHPFARFGFARHRRIGVGGVLGHHARDREGIFGREFEIALVVPGHAHDRAGAVIHQHEVGDEQGQRLAGEGVFGGDGGPETELFGGFERGCGRPALLALVDERSDLRIIGERARHRMIRRDRDEACAEDRIGPGGVDRQRLAARQLEAELEPLALADPVFLHQPDLLGPVLELAEPVEQILREIGDLEEPLVKLAFLDLRARAPALAVDHLFVGEHGHVDRIPVDLALAAIDEARFVKVEEQRLFMAIIFRIAGRDLAAPVEREADALQLRLHRCNVGARPLAGVDALFHRRVLGRHPERVPPHRMEHFGALHLLEPREHVAHRVIAHVAHVNAPAGVGEHLEDVALGLVARCCGAEGAGLLPGALPALVGARRIESGGVHAGMLRTFRPTRASAQPAIALRRRSRALVRMMSSSFCTVAAWTGASTQPGPCATWRMAETRSASARRS